MQDFILQIIEISTITGIIILLLIKMASFLNKRYVAKFKCIIWLVLGIRLLLPMNFFSVKPLIQLEDPWMKQAVKQEMSTSSFSYEIDEENISNTDIVENEVISDFQNDDKHLQSNDTKKEININLNENITLKENLISGNQVVNLLFTIWLVGVCIFAIYHIISYIIFRSNILCCSRVCENKEWLKVADNISWQMDIKKTPEILISKEASSPMILGILQPKLILTEEYYKVKELSFIFSHELTHYKRKDVLFKLLLLAANAVHWFNPAVYLMFREASGDLECFCDDRVMQNIPLEGRRAYTEIIFNYLFRQKVNERTMSTYFYGGKNNMINRFENILNKKPKKQGKSILVLLLCGCLCIGNLVGCSSQENENKTNLAKEGDSLQDALLQAREQEKEEAIKVENKISLQDALLQALEQEREEVIKVEDEIKAQEEIIKKEKELQDLMTSLEESKTLTKPPIMQLKDSLSSTFEYFEVNAGTCSWNYKKGNTENTLKSYVACGLAPQNAVEGTKYLHLNNYNKIDYAPYSMTFSVMPSHITIIEYDIKDIGNDDAEVLSEKTYEDFIGLELRRNRIYEVVAEWTEEDFGEYGFHGNAHYAFATGDTTISEENNKEYRVWTHEEIENMEPKNSQTVSLIAHIKEIYEDENYVVISSDTDEFPGAFVLIVSPEVYGYENIYGGEWFKINMVDTGEMKEGLHVYEATGMISNVAYSMH